MFRKLKFKDFASLDTIDSCVFIFQEAKIHGFLRQSPVNTLHSEYTKVCDVRHKTGGPVHAFIEKAFGKPSITFNAEYRTRAWVGKHLVVTAANNKGVGVYFIEGSPASECKKEWAEFYSAVTGEVSSWNPMFNFVKNG